MDVMDEISRYKFEYRTDMGDYLTCAPSISIDGDYVEYDEHARICAAQDKLIAELESQLAEAIKDAVNLREALLGLLSYTLAPCMHDRSAEIARAEKAVAAMQGSAT